MGRRRGGEGRRLTIIVIIVFINTTGSKRSRRQQTRMFIRADTRPLLLCLVLSIAAAAIVAVICLFPLLYLTCCVIRLFCCDDCITFELICKLHLRARRASVSECSGRDGTLPEGDDEAIARIAMIDAQRIAARRAIRGGGRGTTASGCVVYESITRCSFSHPSSVAARVC